MSYAKSVLQPGETIIAIAQPHWIIYGWAIFYLVVGTGLVMIEGAWGAPGLAIEITAGLFGLLFLLAFVYAWFLRWITEFAVTNRRIIYSRVFLWRDTEEMSMDKVETVDVDQTILGRILGYGLISITGTGGSKDITVERIAGPFELRSAIMTR